MRAQEREPADRGQGARVVACECGPASALAAEISRRIEDGPGRIGSTQTIVIDGCSARCASRLLAAEDVDTVGVDLHDLGIAPMQELDLSSRARLADEVLTRLELALAAPRRPLRHKRPFSPSPAAPDPRRVHGGDDYLYAIHMIGSRAAGCGAVLSRAPVLAAHVAHVLSVSRPSAGAMLERLEEATLIRRGKAREILLTAEGHARAEGVIRRHRLVECFVVDFLGYTLAEAHDVALRVRAGFADEAAERLAEQLGQPKRCPHGWPTDAAREHEWLREVVSLASLPIRAKGEIVALVENEAHLIEPIVRERLALGDLVRLDGREEGMLLVTERRGQHMLPREAAAAVLVSVQP